MPIRWHKRWWCRHRTMIKWQKCWFSLNPDSMQNIRVWKRGDSVQIITFTKQGMAVTRSNKYNTVIEEQNKISQTLSFKIYFTSSFFHKHECPIKMHFCLQVNLKTFICKERGSQRPVQLHSNLIHVQWGFFPCHRERPCGQSQSVFYRPRQYQ